MNVGDIDSALVLLGERLALSGTDRIRIAVCGGSALMSAQLISRQTTKDIDVVAVIDSGDQVVSPDPLPDLLNREAVKVARDMDLPPDWINNGPSRSPGGLFQLGLPDGFKDRLVRKDYGPCFSVYFAGRLDQICFKVYAAVDQGAGRHVDDLLDLNPSEAEIRIAALWAMTHDPSEGFRQVLVSMLEKLGYESTAAGI